MSPIHIRLAAMLAAGGLGCAGPALAETAPPFPDLLARSSQAPTRLESQAGIDAAEGRLLQSRAWKNPELSLDVENFAGKGALEGFDAAETTLSLSQTLELGGKRAARIAGASQGLKLARAQDAQARADYAAALALAYAEAEAADRRVAQAGDLLAAAQTDARAARLLVEAGKEARLRALQAEAEAQSAEAALEEEGAAREAAFAKLSALAGVERPFDALAASLLDAAPPSPAADARGATPSVQAAEADRDRAQAQVQVERLQALPELTLSAGVRRFAGGDSTAFVAGAALPLPLFDRNRGNAAAARADLRAAEARLARARLDARADLTAAHAQARGAAARVAAAQAGEAAATEAYRLARIGYEAGRLPLIELTAARRALASARLQALEARLARVRAQAEAARLAGKTPFGA